MSLLRSELQLCVRYMFLVIPSEVEETPLLNPGQCDGILRLRFTALRMTSWITLASAQVTPRGELKILRA
jgi:hypothetical protein